MEEAFNRGALVDWDRVKHYTFWSLGVLCGLTIRAVYYFALFANKFVMGALQVLLECFLRRPLITLLVLFAIAQGVSEGFKPNNSPARHLHVRKR